MKGRIVFIGKLLLFFLILGATYWFALHQMSSGYVDKYYPKFTTESKSLIVGLSRAQYGLAPQVFEAEFPKTVPMVNFAFELYQSPYGPSLLQNIKNKMRQSSQGGLFILEVSPASFLIPKGIETVELEILEKETLLGKMKQTLHQKPNYQYLIKCYGSALYKGFWRMKPYGNITVHEDGWIAFASQYDDYKITPAMAAEWKTQTLQSYEKVIDLQQISQERLQSFVETIQYLKKYGAVYITRMPISEEIRAFEHQYWNDFNLQMAALAQKEQVLYFDHSNEASNYQFYDGSHFFDQSAIAYSKFLSQAIKSNSIEDY